MTNPNQMNFVIGVLCVMTAIAMYPVIGIGLALLGVYRMRKGLSF